MGSQSKHDKILKTLYDRLQETGDYTQVLKNTEYPYEPKTRTRGEVDVLAFNYHTATLELYEVKSNKKYEDKARSQLNRSKKYFRRFKVDKINTFFVYRKGGLEKIVKTNGR
jgi:hypothetical protein